MQSGGQTLARALVIEVAEQIFPPEITTADLPDGVIGTAYADQTLTATMGDGSYAWSVLVGALPDGLDLSGDGVISGTPTVMGTFDFTVQVTSAEMTDDAPLSITVYDVVDITTVSLPDGYTGQPYGQVLAATGGDAQYSWSLVSGALPPA